MEVPQFVPQHKPDSELVTWVKRRLRPYKSLLGPIALRMSGVAPLSDFERKVLLTQVEDFNPDVILNQTIQSIDFTLIGAMRRPGRFMIAQIGVDPPPGLDTSVYDLGISQIPWVVEYFRTRGLRAERHHLGFEPAILDRLGPAPAKDIDVSFVGGLSAAHTDRVKFLEDIARQYRLSLWTPSLAGIPASSPLHACRQGEVYGRDMYQVLRRSRITLNSHINVARGCATNMRLFEATGMGTFLLTDNLHDLPSLFLPGRDVETYDVTKDCLEKIGRYLADNAGRETIARAGQAQTLAHHSYLQRSAQVLEFVSRHA
jgi:spore maturation protein CgeB